MVAMVTSSVETDLGAMTCESECSSTDCQESDSEEKWDENHTTKVMTPLKSALKKPSGERNYKNVTFSSTTVVYTDDAPEGFEEPMKGIELCLTFEPPLEYQDYEMEFRDNDSECEWFPVISVNQNMENDDSDDSDEWDVLQTHDDDVSSVISLEDVKLEEDSESSDSSQDTIILITPTEEEKQCEANNSEENHLEDTLRSEDKSDESDTSTIEDVDELVDIEPDNNAEQDSLVAEPEYNKEQESEEIYSKTSDIRRTIEESASRRILIGGAEAKRRQTSCRLNYRASSTDCLSEKLRWLACPESLWDNNVTVPNDVREWKIETSRSDELEQFVEQYLTRIERIRKRYSLTDIGFVRNPSIRGIRPRFGSTIEILQQLQSQIRPHPLASAKGHLTWPSHRNSYCGNSDIICGLKEERGVPEGASSSPMVSSDSLYAGCDSSNEGVIYYSLNI